jgi:acetyl esterase
MSSHAHSPRTVSVVATGAAAAASLAGSLLLWFRSSPLPAAVLIRVVSDRNGRRIAVAMGRHVPGGIGELLDQEYLADHRRTLLDVFYPTGAGQESQQLPTIVWLHGGAWISGSKNNIAHYLRILASHGFTTVGVGYSLASDHKYPEPVRQAAAALSYLERHAERLHIDPFRMVLAGDSAGAQIAAQLALVVSDPDYAKRLGIAAPIAADRLRAVLLHCGGYDLSLVGTRGGSGQGFLRTVLWSYTGSRNYLELPYVRLASVTKYVGKNFPPAFISAGNADPLLPHSLALARTLATHGVEVEEFFPSSSSGLRHQYQFELDKEAARQALERSIDFLRRHTG